jgi:hypothetical protein
VYGRGSSGIEFQVISQKQLLCTMFQCHHLSNSMPVTCLVQSQDMLVGSYLACITEFNCSNVVKFIYYAAAKCAGDASSVCMYVHVLARCLTIPS